MDVFKFLQTELATFAAERDWNQFHTPKNLAIALAGEAGELLERFQWLTPEQSEPNALSSEALQGIEEEMAGVLLYVVRLADRLNVNLTAISQAKLQRNGEKYPVNQSKGTPVMYSRRTE